MSSGMNLWVLSHILTQTEKNVEKGNGQELNKEKRGEGKSRLDPHKEEIVALLKVRAEKNSSPKNLASRRRRFITGL